jgi:hypothetical protein
MTGILDTIINTRQQETLRNFDPNLVVKDILSLIKERDREILSHRFGLQGKPVKTLAAIGQAHNLTRERVRQIEKDLMKNLKKSVSKVENFGTAKDFILNVISEHGRIIAEENLFLHLNLKDESEKNSVIFLLHLIEELDYFLHENYRKSWVSVLFEEDLMHTAVKTGQTILENKKETLASESFLQHFKETEFYRDNQTKLSDQMILNFLALAINIEKNVFGHWGLSSWKEVKPKDVGDKAYLVMKHHGKPEHYSNITEMINKAAFDSKKAYKETVHNELIKDPRFILVGRGIYALSEWGYKPGVVSDVIAEVLREAQKPLSRDEILNEVMKRRVVKKNTVLVGLSNKQLFKKVGKNQYALA